MHTSKRIVATKLGDYSKMMSVRQGVKGCAVRTFFEQGGQIFAVLCQRLLCTAPYINYTKFMLLVLTAVQ